MVFKKKPNIFLITFDDCRADHMGFLGCKKNTTPFLDFLARKSAYFTNAFATGAGSPQSFVGAMTSTYPADFGGFSRIAKPRVLLSEVMKKAGYRTVAVHSAAYLSAYFGYGAGWDVFRYLSSFKGGGGVLAGDRRETARAGVLRKIAATRNWLNEKVTPLGKTFRFLELLIAALRKVAKDAANLVPPFASADEINAEVGEILRERSGKPLFLWVHYMDAHEPLGFFMHSGHGFIKKFKYYLADLILMFDEYPKFCRLFRPLYEELYDASIREVDRGIRELFSFLESEGLADENSAAVFLSDHGEEFFEHGDFGHRQKPFNVNLNVPLMFYSTGKINAGGVNRPVSLLDVSPTLADIAGVKKPKNWKGKNIFAGEGREVVSQLIDAEGDLTNLRFLGATIIDNGYKFISYRGEKMLFSLEDKGEENNLYAAKRKLAGELEEKLKKYMPENAPR